MTSSSQFYGVCWHPRGKWLARVRQVGDGHRYVGYYDSEIEAARAVVAKMTERIDTVEAERQQQS